MAIMQEVTRRMTIEARSVGVKEATASARQLSDAVDGVAVASVKTEKATQSMEGRLNSIQRKYDASFRARKDFERAERDLLAIQAQGLISIQRQAELLDLVASRHGIATTAMQKEIIATNQLAAAGSKLAAVNDNNARFRRQNLTYQLFDIGQSGFGGTSAAMIAAQQGPQILQLYAGQGGVNAALKDTMSLLGGVASRFAPVAVAAGVASIAIAGIRDEINETSKVQVTFGDTAKAIWQVSADAIEQQLQPAIQAIAPEAESAWDAIRDGSREAFNAMIQGVMFAYESVKYQVSAIPDLFIIAGEAAANGFYSAIRWMVNAVLDALRSVAAAMNGFIDSNGGEVLRKKLGWDAVDWVPKELEGKTLNIGGEDALERLTKSAEAYQKRVVEIGRSDPLGKMLGTVGGYAGKNAVERMNELAKSTKGAGSAAREAQREFDSFVRTADRLAEKMFPGAYARKEAEELTAQLDQYGEKLTEIQRIAVETRIADQFEAARLGVRDLEKETKDATKSMAEDLEGTFGSALADLFSTPMKDADEFFDKLADGFAQIGRGNLERAFDGIFSGPKQGAANDNTTLYDYLTKGVEKGARIGSREGAAGGTFTALAGLGDLFKGPGGQMLGLGLGAAGMGYQSQNPIMGGIGGAISGFSAGSSITSLGAAGGPLGLVIGAIGGKVGNPFSKEEKAA